tara:strand:+ start:2503 stop:4167 length:1665 start_codon:yes stop_codon:yes gene_type:complete
MPVIFSPGEAETRPLYPESIVYTTAQKVADLLGIGVGEALAVSANTVANAVFVTGADYRDHGFSVGDSILVYSDAFPLGFTAEIDTIVSGGGNGVKLNLKDINGSGSATIASHVDLTDVAVADNTYVQNQASFTNGKTRGMKRSVVEERIKEVQDRIDSVSHNAWRPYLVVAEYINFDTYKPYRRRYYTDYVGTTPLLFRNVQQILRIELWQGDNYRELAGAEARLEIGDHSALTSDEIFLCPGGGGFAKLGVGTGTQQWDAAFNKVTTAQNLADLINNEDRTNRGTVSFTTNADSPVGTTYTQPDGASSTGVTNINVHNEFLATANADYGSGKLKVTSMQPAGGKEATIAVTDTTNISITQTKAITGSGTVNTTPADGTRTITFTDSSTFAQYGLVRSSTGTIYGYATNSGTVLGSCRLLFNGYGVSDDTAYTWTQHQFQPDLGFLSGTSGDQARLKDWWLDHEMGIIYFNNSYPFFEWNAVKVSYIYGERYLEKAVQEAATKMVAADLLMSDDRSVLIPEGTQNVDLASKIQLWRKEADEIMRRYKEVVVFD